VLTENEDGGIDYKRVGVVEQFDDNVQDGGAIDWSVGQLFEGVAAHVGVWVTEHATPLFEGHEIQTHETTQSQYPMTNDVRAQLFFEQCATRVARLKTGAKELVIKGLN
jgi:hypothetical protein